GYQDEPTAIARASRVGFFIARREFVCNSRAVFLPRRARRSRRSQRGRFDEFCSCPSCPSWFEMRHQPQVSIEKEVSKMTETLLEFCDSRGVRVRVDRAAGVIRGVK